jgi:hypothetical protein
VESGGMGVESGGMGVESGGMGWRAGKLGELFFVFLFFCYSFLISASVPRRNKKEQGGA